MKSRSSAMVPHDVEVVQADFGLPKARNATRRVALLSCSVCWLALLMAFDLIRRLAGSSRVRCVALYYHGVSAAQRGKFERQMEALARATTVIPPDPNELPPGFGTYSIVTFDDGFRSVVENALPALRKIGIRAAIFVPSGSLGMKPIWLAGLGHRDYDEECVLTAAELVSLAEDMVIGSHSRTHRRLSGLSRAEILEELEGSKADLERMIGRPVDLLSFPHGDCDRRVLRAAAEVGYRRVFSIVPRLSTLSSFTVDRFEASPDDWPVEFALKIRGAYSWLWPAQRLKRRVARFLRQWRPRAHTAAESGRIA